jgi:hypothetical protein
MDSPQVPWPFPPSDGVTIVGLRGLDDIDGLDIAEVADASLDVGEQLRIDADPRDAALFSQRTTWFDSRVRVGEDGQRLRNSERTRSEARWTLMQHEHHTIGLRHAHARQLGRSVLLSPVPSPELGPRSR